MYVVFGVPYYVFLLYFHRRAAFSISPVKLYNTSFFFFFFFFFFSIGRSKAVRLSKESCAS